MILYRGVNENVIEKGFKKKYFSDRMSVKYIYKKIQNVCSEKFF